MAPSATAAGRATSTVEKSSANGKANGAAPASSNGASTAERDAIENKYRDFFWTYTEEPHRTRRLEIIKAHPEVCPFLRLSLRIAPLTDNYCARSRSFAVRNL
jgi:sphingolipid delta-4 desaturase